MSTYDDYDGVFFSIQSLRLYHELDNSVNIEYVVLDNNPRSQHGTLCKNFLTSSVRNSLYIPFSNNPTSFNKYRTVEYASGDIILIIDSHVLLVNNSINNIIKYFQDDTNKKNLLQGPLLYDDLKHVSTHLDPVWRDDMYGIWATNFEAYQANLPFEIPMQGMGLCAFKKDYWPGIHNKFRGFGGEEGYIAEKFRQNGGKNICLPSLQWNHRFGRPYPIPYPLLLEDKIWNYFLGWLDITKDVSHPMIKDIYHFFENRLSKSTLDTLLLSAEKQIV